MVQYVIANKVFNRYIILNLVHPSLALWTFTVHIYVLMHSDDIYLFFCFKMYFLPFIYQP